MLSESVQCLQPPSLQQNCRFLDLPAEVRLIIYDFLLIPSDQKPGLWFLHLEDSDVSCDTMLSKKMNTGTDLACYLKAGRPDCAAKSLIQTCRRVNDEFTPMFLQQKTIVFKCERPLLDLSRWQFTWFPSTELRHVQLDWLGLDESWIRATSMIQPTYLLLKWKVSLQLDSLSLLLRSDVIDYMSSAPVCSP